MPIEFVTTEEQREKVRQGKVDEVWDELREDVESLSGRMRTLENEYSFKKDHI